MNSFELYIRGKRHRFSGPSTWSELSGHQRIGLMRLRAAAAGRSHTPTVLFAGLTLLYGIAPRQQRWLFDAGFLRRQKLSEIDVALSLDLGQSLLDTLDWIGQDDSQASFPASFRPLDFRYGSVPVLLGRLWPQSRYAGPADGMASSTFEEFMLTDHAFTARDLPRLAAVLYRPLRGDAKPGADARQPLDLDDIDERTKAFIHLDPALLEAIAFGYGNTLLGLKSLFKHVFPENTEPKARKSTGSPWLNVALGLAKLDVTKIKAVEQTNLYLALKVLDEQIRQADELEAQLEKHRKK